MSSENFIRKLFAKLTKADFYSDTFLKGFYIYFKKSKDDNIFESYINYITRNENYNDEDCVGQKEAALSELYDQIKDAILYGEIEEERNAGFLTEKDLEEKRELTDEESKKQAEQSKQPSKLITDVNKQRVDLKQTGVVKLNKTKALKMLSRFIKQSFIITYADPAEISNEQDQEYRELTTSNIIYEIENVDGLKLPEPKKDVEFGKRVDMMNIWLDTENKCKTLCEEPKLYKMLSTVYFIDTTQLSTKQNSLTTIKMPELDEILPPINFVSCYSNEKYNTIIRITNNDPIFDVVNLAKAKQRPIYICSVCPMVQGGNADQGLDVLESMLYMRSTYSVGLTDLLHAYPLTVDQAFICPTVLVFKDQTYQSLPVTEYQKIAVLGAPNKWRAELKNTDLDISNLTPDKYIYLKNTTFKDAKLVEKLKASLCNVLETALFFGYDTVVLDDRDVLGNVAPAHCLAQIVRHAINKYVGRFKEIVISINKAESFKVFRLYF